MDIGKEYLLNNEKVIYLGARFVSKMIPNKYIRFDRITKIKKIQYILKNDSIIELDGILKEFESIKVLTEQECSRLLTFFYRHNFNLTYFSKNDLKGNLDYGFIDCEECIISPFVKINDAFYTKVQNSKSIGMTNFFFKDHKFKNNSFEFKLELNGKSFNYVDAVPVKENSKSTLQRIGIIKVQ